MAIIRNFVATATLWLASMQAATAMAAQPATLVGLKVDLDYASYQGFHNATTRLNVWRGIRYAAPPTGDLRWRAPISPIRHHETINATTLGSACIQVGPPPFIIPVVGSEDCLFLNIYAPIITTGEKLPVMVWVHGGGYAAGDGSQDMGEIINANRNGFLVVSINYRLGAFGFLSSAEIEANGDVNAGILDMELALKWVQKNIGKFGGDAKRVTLAGQSAGAGGVMLLTIARNGSLETTLFQNMITSSPYLPPQYAYNAAIPTQRYQDFASAAGCTNSTSMLACLRSKDVSTLQSANAVVNAASFYGYGAFAPVTDRKFIASLPSVALASKRINGAKILATNNAEEGSIFVPTTINSEETLKRWLSGAFPTFTTADVTAVLATYPSSSANSPLQRAINIMSETAFVCSSYWLNDAFSQKPSFHYQYSVGSALHGDDLQAVFGPATSVQPPGLIKVMRTIWGEFIMSGSPVKALPSFPVWVEGTSGQMVNLNATDTNKNFTVVNAQAWEGGRGKRCAFWKGMTRRGSV